MKVVVTGASGFIGGHLTADFREDGHRVRAVEVKPVNRWFQHHGADDMGGMGFIENYKVARMLTVLLNAHLLTAVHEYGVELYVLASSACVCGQDLQDDLNVNPLLRRTFTLARRTATASRSGWPAHISTMVRGKAPAASRARSLRSTTEWRAPGSCFTWGCRSR